MRRTLYLKIIIAYLLFAIFGFFTVGTFVDGMLTEYCTKDASVSMYREATEISNTLASELYNSETSLDSVYRQLHTLSQYTSCDIWILNPSGRMVVRSDEKLDPEEELFVDGFDPAALGNSYYTEGTFWNAFEDVRLSVIVPITTNYKINGYVAIHKAMADIDLAVSKLLNICYIFLAVLFLLSLIILIVFTEAVYNPLKKIITATEQYAAGNMQYRITVDSGDEMGYLAASLTYMANRIARHDEDQKKFIANISHDFRSPLTSIRGFLTAMIDGTIPPELHEKYLGIVLNETERLTKLTNGLLSLNSLGKEGIYLQLTDFDINEVIRSVAASFEQVCKQKGVTIELVLYQSALLVTADNQKIQQVLYNLTDNAIKFSPAGSTIKLETTEKHNKVFVSVKDSGIGIPREEQKLIFDRFYKTDLSRGKDKKGTGLGLSIVKEIIKAHNENINLISTEGIGSEFIFTLKRSGKNDEEED